MFLIDVAQICSSIVIDKDDQFLSNYLRSMQLVVLRLLLFAQPRQGPLEWAFRLFDGRPGVGFSVQVFYPFVLMSSF